MRVGPAAIVVLAPYLVGASCDAAQLPARFGVQFALPASLWVQKETIGKGSCRVGPAGYDDAGAMLWVLNGNITGSVTSIIMEMPKARGRKDSLGGEWMYNRSRWKARINIPVQMLTDRAGSFQT